LFANDFAVDEKPRTQQQASKRGALLLLLFTRGREVEWHTNTKTRKTGLLRREKSVMTETVFGVR
jgi:hypothetical protein